LMKGRGGPGTRRERRVALLRQASTVLLVPAVLQLGAVDAAFLLEHSFWSRQLPARILPAQAGLWIAHDRELPERRLPPGGRRQQRQPSDVHGISGRLRRIPLPHRPPESVRQGSGRGEGRPFRKASLPLFSHQHSAPLLPEVQPRVLRKVLPRPGGLVLPGLARPLLERA